MSGTAAPVSSAMRNANAAPERFTTLFASVGRDELPAERDARRIALAVLLLAKRGGEVAHELGEEVGVVGESGTRAALLRA